MSAKAQLFVGRLNRDVRTRDLEDIFSRYGRLLRCDIKYGTGTTERGQLGYAFVDYEDRRDGDDAIRYENGRELRGERISVEYAKGPRDRFSAGGGGGYGGGAGGYGGGGGRSRSRSPRRRSRSPVRRSRRSPSYGRRSLSRSRSPVQRRRSFSRSRSRSR